MTLLDRLRSCTPADEGRDLLEFFGVDRDSFRIADGQLIVGGETVTLAEAREAMGGTPAQAPPRIRIENL